MKRSNPLNSDWRRITIPHVNAAASNEEPNGLFIFPPNQGKPGISPLRAGFWLNQSSKVFANGTLEARCIGEELLIRNVNVRWTWVDDIDAKSFNENSVEDSAGYFNYFAEGLFDIVFDKVLNSDFGVRIFWSDTSPMEVKLSAIR